MMILLTPAQAQAVRGKVDPMHGLDPIALKDGNFVLPIEVLDDPAFAKHKNVLNKLTLIPDPFPGTPQATPELKPPDSDYL
jgi:hypothetical protein